MRPLASTCATGVGLDATVSVDLCHQSGLGCGTRVGLGATVSIDLCHQSGLGCDR
jgi:hypothetical protein